MISVLLLFALIAALPAEAAAPRSSAPLKVVAFGDSLTSGHRLPLKDAYPAVLEKKVKAAGLPFSVINQGVSGDTTAGALRRLDRALEEKPQILIVELGVNDGLRGVPIPQIKANLAKIIDRGAGAERRGVALRDGGAAAPGLAIHHRISQDDRGPRAEYGVPLVPFVMNGVLGNPDMISDDGVHPNAAGARYIAGTIWEYLEPMARKLLEQDPLSSTTLDKR